MTEVPNYVTPRMFAVGLISVAIDRAQSRLDAHRRNARDPRSLYHDRILTYLEQVVVELRTAARLLERHDPEHDDDPTRP